MSATVSVSVAAPGLTACFTFDNTPALGVTTNFDSACSSALLGARLRRAFRHMGASGHVKRLAVAEGDDTAGDRGGNGPHG